MAYFIAIDSRYNKGEVLFMADRSKTKARFWTKFKTDAFAFANESAAADKAASYQHNSARVVSEKEAIRIDARNLIAAEEADTSLGEHPMEWDGHKF